MPRIPKIVDTNVCIVSNRRGGEDLRCASKCATEIKEVVSHGILVIDARDGVFEEYRKYLSFSGQPGMGDLFFKWLVDNRYRQDRVASIRLTPHPEREYAEFPEDPELEGFDRDDRVFVALACVHPRCPSILNAVDSDYWHYREPLTRNGVTVTHVCGHGHYKPRLG